MNGVWYCYPTPAKEGFTFQSMQCSRDANASMNQTFDISTPCEACDAKTGKNAQGQYAGSGHDKFDFGGDWRCGAVCGACELSTTLGYGGKGRSWTRVTE